MQEFISSISESTTGYTFTPCVGYFTSPGTDTIQKRKSCFSVSTERHRQMWGERNCLSFETAAGGIEPLIWHCTGSDDFLSDIAVLLGNGCSYLHHQCVPWSSSTGNRSILAYRFSADSDYSRLDLKRDIQLTIIQYKHHITNDQLMSWTLG